MPILKVCRVDRSHPYFLKKILVKKVQMYVRYLIALGNSLEKYMMKIGRQLVHKNAATSNARKAIWIRSPLKNTGGRKYSKTFLGYRFKDQLFGGDIFLFLSNTSLRFGILLFESYF